MAEGKLPFRDRREAGVALGQALTGRVGPGALILGLARGGVPVAARVARAVGGELDVLVVRKVGVPSQPELAMGAVAAGITVRNEDVLAHVAVPEPTFERVRDRARAELAEREQRYRRGRAEPAITGREVVLVDDGLATGTSMRAAAIAVRWREPARVVVAVPVAAADTLASLDDVADEVVAVATPEPFGAVGFFYLSFDAVSDQEVVSALADPG